MLASKKYYLMENVEKELECPICLELFTQPINLECSHSICEEHVKSITKGIHREPNNSLTLFVSDSRITCPLCKQITKVQDKSLPINYIAKGLVETLKRQTVRFMKSQIRTA